MTEQNNNNLIASAIEYMNKQPLPSKITVELDNGQTYDISGYVGDVEYSVDEQGNTQYYNKETKTYFSIEEND